MWFSPFPCDLTAGELLPLLEECAERAEALRREGAEVVLVTGGELSLFARGFLPGDDFLSRIALVAGRGPELPGLLRAVPERVNAFLAEAVAALRAHPGTDAARATAREWAQRATSHLTALADSPARRALETYAATVADRVA